MSTAFRHAAFAALSLTIGFGAALAQDGAATDGAATTGEPPLSVEVPFVTNRARDPGRTGFEAYNGARGISHFGRCRVEFTPIPLVERIAPKLKFYVPRTISEVLLAEEVDRRAFWEGVVAAAGQVSSRAVVLFVHGYNYGFERTCLMAAELQRILHGRVAVVAFSWPSNGSAADYVPDQADVEWSVPLLAETVAELAGRLGPERVRLLAHSLGSRGTLFALQWLDAARVARPVVDRLVLVAPDFDAEAFVDRLPALAALAGDITLYASETDAALKVSRQLHGAPRLGEAGAFLTVAEGMETIDVTPSGRYQLLGHEYFYFQPQVAADIAELLATGRSADLRRGLEPRHGAVGGYWEVTPR